MDHLRAPIALLAVTSLVAHPLYAAIQQVADKAFRPAVAGAAFPPGTGPRILVDEAHHNFHTAGGRYRTFAQLLRRDGFVVLPNRETFSAAGLQGTRILVIANAHSDSTAQWVLPTKPAFTESEVHEVERWVLGGGSLLLIADHMPFAGAAANLARAFGLIFHDGYALGSGAKGGQHTFRRSDRSLSSDIITDGASPAERIDSVVSFTGQAFRSHREVRPLLTIDSTLTLFFTIRNREIGPKTPKASAEGLYQGAALRHGRGRVAVFGEAAMFSAQLAGPQRVPIGMNHPTARQNAQLALNVVHWLVGLLEPDPRGTR